MVTKMKINKVIAKDLAGTTPIAKNPKKESHYFAERNVDKAKKQGWKEVKRTSLKGVRDKVFGIKTHQADLVLMER